MKLFVRWLLLAAALLLVAQLYPGVAVRSFGSAMLAALVLGLFNTLVRPLLVLLTHFHPRTPLSADETKAIDALKDMLAKIADVKEKHSRPSLRPVAATTTS